MWPIPLAPIFSTRYRVVGAQHRQRQADLVVEGSGRGGSSDRPRRAPAPAGPSCRRLADDPAGGHDPQPGPAGLGGGLAQPAQHLARQGAEGGHDIGHDDLRQRPPGLVGHLRGDGGGARCARRPAGHARWRLLGHRGGGQCRAPPRGSRTRRGRRTDVAGCSPRSVPPVTAATSAAVTIIGPPARAARRGRPGRRLVVVAVEHPGDLLRRLVALADDHGVVVTGDRQGVADRVARLVAISVTSPPSGRCAYAPARIDVRIAAGSSERGFSSVMTSTSASRGDRAHPSAACPGHGRRGR